MTGSLRVKRRRWGNDGDEDEEEGMMGMRMRGREGKIMKGRIGREGTKRR